MSINTNTHTYFSDTDSNELIDGELQMESKLILFFESNLFVGWDASESVYYVRGINKNNVPFGFYINSDKSCLNFIKYFNFNNDNFSNDNLCATLYNYNNIANWNTEELTYEFFESYRDDRYVVSRIGDSSFRDIKEILSLLSDTYNYSN